MVNGKRRGWRASKIVKDDEDELKSDILYSEKDLIVHSLDNLRYIQLWSDWGNVQKEEYRNNTRIISNNTRIKKQLVTFLEMRKGTISKILGTVLLVAQLVASKWETNTTQIVYSYICMYIATVLYTWHTWTAWSPEKHAATQADCC